MASAAPRKRTRRKASDTRKFEEGLPLSNKKQILGFFMAILSFMVILSIISYSELDQSRLENFKISEIFAKQSKSQNFNTGNWLGIIGVVISGFFVRSTFGYFSVIIPSLFLFMSVFLIRKKELNPYMQFTFYSLLSMAMMCTFAGLLNINLGPDKMLARFSGNSGAYLANIIYHMIGSFGGYILVLIALASFIFLAVNLDIFKAIAKLRAWIDDIREKMKRPEKPVQKVTDKKEIKPVVFEEEYEEEPSLIKETNINRPVDDAMVSTPVKKQKIVLDIVGEEEKFAPPKEIFKPVKQESKKPKESLPNDLGDIVEGKDAEYIQEDLKDFRLPTLDLLDEPAKDELDVISDDELKENGKLLQAKLLHFGVKIEKVIATPGPVVTLYELVPAEDVKLSRIESLQDDIALAMKAKGIRMIIPIPGKGTVGIEIPNHKPSTVKVKSVIGSKKFMDTSYQLPIAVGKTISGEVYIDDLARMPHLLIAGSTGSGKSVGINTIITSLIYKLHPSKLKFILIDPKKIELNQYAKLLSHYLAVSKDTNEKIITTPQNSVMILKSLEMEMEKRYEKLANATVRNIADYNKKFDTGVLKDHEDIKHSRMPYLICIIDELADLMITAAREVEEPIARLAQLARAVGIHLVLATQRPSVDVITGVIKANFSARIAYLVNSKVDSRTILDMNGAEQLIGMGDMLYLPPGVPKPVRIQNPYISVDEVDKVTDYISRQKGFSRPYELPSMIEKKKKAYSSEEDRDELFEEAARLVIRHQRGSVSMLQRRLKVGYARAARIVDELEAAGIVGPGQGSKERDVLMESEAELEAVL